MSTTYLPAIESDPPPTRPVAHIAHPWKPRRALCGAEILDIPAFGDYDDCEICFDIAELISAAEGGTL